MARPTLVFGHAGIGGAVTHPSPSFFYPKKRRKPFNVNRPVWGLRRNLFMCSNDSHRNMHTNSATLAAYRAGQVSGVFGVGRVSHASHTAK